MTGDMREALFMMTCVRSLRRAGIVYRTVHRISDLLLALHSSCENNHPSMKLTHMSDVLVDSNSMYAHGLQSSNSLQIKLMPFLSHDSNTVLRSICSRVKFLSIVHTSHIIKQRKPLRTPPSPSSPSLHPILPQIRLEL